MLNSWCFQTSTLIQKTLIPRACTLCEIQKRDNAGTGKFPKRGVPGSSELPERGVVGESELPKRLNDQKSWKRLHDVLVTESASLRLETQIEQKLPQMSEARCFTFNRKKMTN
jgi:hypothetical protein